MSRIICCEFKDNIPDPYHMYDIIHIEYQVDQGQACFLATITNKESLDSFSWLGYGATPILAMEQAYSNKQLQLDLHSRYCEKDLKPISEFWLNSNSQKKTWGPFRVEQHAWHYLFGRHATDQEIRMHQQANWSVMTIPIYDIEAFSGTLEDGFIPGTLQLKDTHVE